MKNRKQISAEDAMRIGESLFLNWDQVDPELFRQGLMGNLEPDTMDPETGLTYDGVVLSGKVVLSHMQEFPDYFTRLAKLKAEADAYQTRRR